MEMQKHLADLYHNKEGPWSLQVGSRSILSEGRYTLEMVRIDRAVREVINHH